MDNHPFFIMGLFDETRTYIASTTESLIQDTPDYIRQSILNSILANRELVPDILDATLNSFAVKDIRPMFEYARDVYTNGLPEGSKGWSPAKPEVVRDVLYKEYPWILQQGKTINIISVALGDPSDQAIGLERLLMSDRFQRWETDRNGNLLYPTQFLYLWGDGEVRRSEIKFYRLNYEGTPIQIEANTWFNGVPSDTPYKFYDYHEPIVTTAGSTYYTVNYQILNSDGSVYNDTRWPKNERWWSYYPKSQRYPELNLDSESGDQPSGTFYFPVVPLRVNYTSLTSQPYWNTPLYQTSKKLLNFMDIKIEELHEGVNNNPDIANINHAYVVFGVDVHTTSDAGKKYLYEYFEDEFARARTNEFEYLKWWTSPIFGPAPLNSVKIEDATYKIELGFAYITVKEYSGVVGKVGDLTKDILIADKNPMRIRWPGGGNGMLLENHMNRLILRKQITNNRYKELIVHGLVHINNIFGSGLGYFTGLWGSINLTGGEQQNTPLVIPLNVAIAQSLPLRDANTLYYESIKIVFNAFEVVKLKWYETSFFRFVSQILVLAVSVVTGGLANLVNSITVAISAGLTATALLISKMIIVSALASATFKFAVEEAGLDVGYVFAGLALAYGVSGSLLDLPLADTFLSIGTNLNKAVTSLTQEAITEVTTELTDLEEEYQTKLESLEDLLKPTERVLDPLSLFTNVGMLPNESPTDYFTRTTELKNPGILSIESVYNFVNTKLDLNLI